MTEFLAGPGAMLRDLPHSIRHPDYAARYAQPAEKEIGRAAGMTHPDNAVLAGMALLACPTQLGATCIKHSLAIVERMDEAAAGAPLTDDAAVVSALRILFVINPVRATPATLKRNLEYYEWTRRSLDRWWENAPAPQRAPFTRFLLPPVPSDVSSHVALAFQTSQTVDEEGQPEPSERESKAEVVSQERAAILSKLEVRWAATEPLLLKLKAELEDAQRRQAAGEILALPITVSHTWPVVRSEPVMICVVMHTDSQIARPKSIYRGYTCRGHLY